MRYSNVLRIKTYIERMNTRLPASGDRGDLRSPSFPLTPATVNQHRNTPRDDMDEFMLMGLRLTREGVSAAEFRKRFERGIDEVYGADIRRFVSLGLLEWLEPNARLGKSRDTEGMKIRLTRRGRPLGNQVFMAFVR
jgi:oxygen-independent coproporphyrinogen-3 oxidase